MITTDLPGKEPLAHNDTSRRVPEVVDHDVCHGRDVGHREPVLAIAAK